MLPIFGDTNRLAAWPARIAKLKASLDNSINKSDIDNKISGLFIASEQSITEIAPASGALKRSLDLLNQCARSEDAQLTDEFLFELQRALEAEEGLRISEMTGQVPGHNPARPASIATLLETTLDWFGAESFRELHPIEQAVLVHARFLDMQFFPTDNTRLSRFAADFFLIRVSLPPIIIFGVKDRYKAALHQALLMNTQPLIDLIVETTERTLTDMTNEQSEEGRQGEGETE